MRLVSGVLGEREPVASRDWWLVVVAQSLAPFMLAPGLGFRRLGSNWDFGPWGSSHEVWVMLGCRRTVLGRGALTGVLVAG